MKKTLAALLCLISLTIQAQSLDGPYSGELNIMGQMKLHITLRFNNGQCTMDIQEQGAKDIPMEIVYNNGDSLMVSQKEAMIDYKGRVKGDIIEGIFMQSGMTFPLKLKKGETVLERSQTPKDPLPYRTEEVTFRNASDGAVLKGTLTYPFGYGLLKKRVPVVLMVSGSGQQNRDEELMGHKPFLVLADRLANMGVASLRYDDRGAGQSTGSLAGATTKTFAGDAAAGLEFLRKTKKFAKVGVLGHSEGATIAFMLGEQKLPDFIVSMAGPGVKGIEISMEQNRQLAAMTGSTKQVTEEEIRQAAKGENAAWMNFFFDYDPATALSSIKCPLMAVNGTKDFQVDCKQNLSRIKECVPQNAKNVFKEYDGLNHLFQHCQTGFPMEYGQIDETMSAEVMSDIAKWIMEQL